MKRTKRAKAFFVAVCILFASSCTKPDSPVPPFLPSEAESSRAESALQSDVSVPSEPAPTEDKFATLCFGGDILLHGNLINSAKTGDNTYDFTPLLANGMEVFFDGDLNLVNMENPVDVYGENKKISAYPTFNAPIEITDFTRKLGVDTVLYCNNHIYDMKYSGFLATLRNLRRSFDTVGAYASEEEYNTPHIREVNGIKIGILAYTDHVNSFTGSELTPFSVRTFKLRTESAPAMTEDIRELKSAGAETVIVCLHWGSEYKDTPSSTQKQLAHALCEGGADIIVGSHSHCVQPIEKYSFTDGNGQEKSSLIMYSLGNFFADQTSLQTMEGYGAEYAKTQYGMKVTVKLKKDGESGEISIFESEYLPTFLFRRRVSGKYEYLFMESGKYAFAEEKPEIFETDAEWQKCKDGFEHVKTTVGQAVPIKEYTNTD